MLSPRAASCGFSPAFALDSKSEALILFDPPMPAEKLVPAEHAVMPAAATSTSTVGTGRRLIVRYICSPLRKN
jgi:hypothetical protein